MVFVPFCPFCFKFFVMVYVFIVLQHCHPCPQFDIMVDDSVTCGFMILNEN